MCGCQGVQVSVLLHCSTIVVKPKELASSIFKNRAGSADDIREADGKD